MTCAYQSYKAHRAEISGPAHPASLAQEGSVQQLPNLGGTTKQVCSRPKTPGREYIFMDMQSKFARTGCRGRCRSQPFATKERYGCGSAACRYTSARRNTPFLLESSANSSHLLGGQSRRPLQYPSAPCRGQRLCPPAERTDFYGNLLRIRSFPTGRVGIGPYRKPCKFTLDKYPVRVYSQDTPMGYLR